MIRVVLTILQGNIEIGDITLEEAIEITTLLVSYGTSVKIDYLSDDK